MFGFKRKNEYGFRWDPIIVLKSEYIEMVKEFSNVGFFSEILLNGERHKAHCLSDYAKGKFFDFEWLFDERKFFSLISYLDFLNAELTDEIQILTVDEGNPRNVIRFENY